MAESKLAGKIFIASDFDKGEIRAIRTKDTETGFIKVSELMKLQKAGYRRPIEVPPRPQPKDRCTPRERTRQKIFRLLIQTASKNCYTGTMRTHVGPKWPIAA